MALRAGANVPQFVQEVVFSLASIAANTVSAQAFTLKGLRTDMLLSVNARSLPTGVFVLPCFVSAKDQITLNVWNATGVATTAGNQTFEIIAH